MHKNKFKGRMCMFPAQDGEWGEWMTDVHANKIEGKNVHVPSPGVGSGIIHFYACAL